MSLGAPSPAAYNTGMTPKRIHHTHFIASGDGPTIILIHGLAASLYDWNLLIPPLVSSGYRTLALDLLGHGESAKPEGAEHYHVEALYVYFKDWIDELKLEAPFLLVGHSLGGYLSLKYAHHHPERVRGLVLIDPFYSPGQLSALLRLMRRRPGPGVRALRATPDWAIHAYLRLDPASIGQFPAEMRKQIAKDYKRASPNILYIPNSLPDLTPELPGISSPALVIWGDKDLTLKPASFPRLVQALPNASQVVIPGSGHQPHIANPELVSRLILDFATRVDGRLRRE